MKDASKDVDMKIVTASVAELENTDEGQAAADKSKMTLQIKSAEGPLHIQVNTAELENKTSAIQIIKDLADSLGPNFIEFVQPVAKLLVTELMHFHLSATIRKASTRTL